MARQYTVKRIGITPTVGNDIMNIVAPANKAIRIKRIRASGEATVSTVMRTEIKRSTGGAAPSGALTPGKMNGSDPAAAASIYTAWATQPTPETGDGGYVEGWNAFGGGFDLTLDGREIYLVSSEQLSIRSLSGTGTSNYEVEFEEL